LIIFLYENSLQLTATATQKDQDLKQKEERETYLHFSSSSTIRERERDSVLFSLSHSFLKMPTIGYSKRNTRPRLSFADQA